MIVAFPRSSSLSDRIREGGGEGGDEGEEPQSYILREYEALSYYCMRLVYLYTHAHTCYQHPTVYYYQRNVRVGVKYNIHASNEFMSVWKNVCVLYIYLR